MNKNLRISYLILKGKIRRKKSS